MRKSNRTKSMFWRSIPWNGYQNRQQEVLKSNNDIKTSVEDSFLPGSHSLTDENQNKKLHSYESQTKNKFDIIESVLREIMSQRTRHDFSTWANNELSNRLGVQLELTDLDLNHKTNPQFAFQKLYSKIVFAQFLSISKDFFVNDPLDGQEITEAHRIFKDAGIHAVGFAPCADGRLAHLISYVLRLPYTLARRKAHAGAMFDISESVRNWVFIEHNRLRDQGSSNALEDSRYLKVAVYHFSKNDPTHQGCAAHHSNDDQAADAAFSKLLDFKQAIENRFGCGSTIEIMLMGLNTDNDSLRLHIPDKNGSINLDRYIETDEIFESTFSDSSEQARQEILKRINTCCANDNSTEPEPGMAKILAWFVENNFSQIQYVKNYENGLYQDIGHAERFIGIGNGFEEVQLRNLSYYSFLDTLEEGVKDVDVGIKIFKGLNIKKGIPIPIIIRCDYDGRVPGSKLRAIKKAKRLEEALHSRYKDLSDCGLLQTMPTLRDHTGFKPAEKLPRMQ